MDEIREALLEAGYSEEEIDGWLARPSTAPPEVQEIMSKSSRGEAFTEGLTDEELAAAAEARELGGSSRYRLGDVDSLVISAAEKIRNGEELSPEELKALGETPGAEDRLDRLIDEFGGDQLAYNWVYRWVTMGSLDSNEALIEFYESLININRSLELPEGATDAEKVESVKDMLARGRENTDILNALMDWGQASGNYAATQKTDDVLNLDITGIMERLGVQWERATTVGRIAHAYDIAPLALADIWGGYGFKDGQIVPVTEEEQFAGDIRDFKKVRRGLGDVAQLYKQGLGLYDQSHLLAAIHISNPGLAQRLRDDPYSLDTGELQTALDLAGGGEGREADPQMNWIKTRLAGGYRASEEVDKESMRNAVQVLADGWNLTGTEAVAAALTSELVSDAVARAQASLPNPFGPLEQGTKITDTIRDQAAAVKRRLRETGEYKELFEHLAGGESEEEFVRRFESRTEQILGDDLVGVARNAMRTGDPNAVFQQALHTPVGDTSTRFQEIMARNAQVFRDYI